jgi:hypothetical protein
MCNTIYIYEYILNELCVHICVYICVCVCLYSFFTYMCIILIVQENVMVKYIFTSCNICVHIGVRVCSCVYVFQFLFIMLKCILCVMQCLYIYVSSIFQFFMCNKYILCVMKCRHYIYIYIYLSSSLVSSAALDSAKGLTFSAFIINCTPP